MDEIAALMESAGFCTRAEARDAGYDDRAVLAMVRGGAWHRIRRGFYTDAITWKKLDDHGRHRVRSRAVLRSLGPGVALSHVSGAIAHNLATWAVDLDRVHVTRLDGGAGRVEPDVVHHVGLSMQDEVVKVDGLRVLAADRCALEAASRTTSEAALVILDSLLHHGHCDHDGLMRRFDLMQHWPYTRHLHIPVRMADGGAHSPGESRGRWFFRVHRLPAPITQFEVRDRDGVLRGTSDWGWPDHGCLGEFDGKVKYGRLLKPGQTAGEVVFAEKQREDLLRTLTDFRMVRLTWDDYGRPRVTARLLREKLRLAS